MNEYRMTFGKHEGLTLEELFFKDPAYVQELIHYRALNDLRLFSSEAAETFIELHQRATNLGGICPWCSRRWITRIGISTPARHNHPNYVGAYCDVCSYLGFNPTRYVHPSMLALLGYAPKSYPMMTKMIREVYFPGKERLSLKAKGFFFSRDENFSEFNLNYFEHRRFRLDELEVI